jgi:hypothetical protein
MERLTKRRQSRYSPGMIPARSIVTILLLCASAAAQAPTSFEAASIRPSVRQDNGRFGNYKNTGGPGSSDPGHMILENFDLRSLILSVRFASLPNRGARLAIRLPVQCLG